MIKEIFSKQKKTFFQYTLLFFILFGLLFFSISSFLQYKINETKKKEIANNEHRLIDVEQKIIMNKLNKITTDLLFLSDCFRMYDNEKEDYSEIEKQWLAFSNRKASYDQIRFLDTDGKEVVRINYETNGSTLVAKEDLQNKKDRPYFIDTMKLKSNQIYLSSLDLNMENNVVENPINPMLRISMPYYDQTGVLKGMIILNYAANDMLEQVKEVSATGNGSMFLLNHEGYWLVDSQNSSNEWSFMYEEEKENTVALQYPEEWKVMQRTKDGFFISENGVFTFSNSSTNNMFDIGQSNYSMVLGGGDWMLVSYLSADSQNGKLYTESMWKIFLENASSNLIWYVIILMVAVFIGFLISINRNIQQRIKHFSEYDAMTEVYNRRAGFEMLNQRFKNTSQKDCHASVCFIDINGLKEVNDALGHDAGDELILSVVNGIKKSIRNNDFVARLGGDEFLIIFEGLNEKESEEIWGRIVQNYQEINETENRAYVISVSHGIKEFACDAVEYIDTIVNQADEKMYEEKRKIKKGLTVVRNML